MELYLLRHGIAAERDAEAYPDDSLRPLIPRGRKRLQSIGKTFRRFAPRIDLLVSSPLLRCRETAQIMESALDLHCGVQLHDGLAPWGDPATLLADIAAMDPAPTSVMLVGHEPCLSELLSVLISGKADALIGFKKGGLAKLEVVKPLTYGCCASLAWLAPPALLANL